MADAFLTPSVAEALKRIDDDQPITYGPWLEVLFPSTSARDVLHGCDATPTGVQIILELGGMVRATDLTAWTPDLAFLIADTANTRARLRFVVTREEFICA